MPDAARQVVLTAQGGTEKPSQLYVEDREAWRSWLAANHSRPGGVWLVLYHKKSGVPTVTYDEAGEGALCFGWVDSRANKRDGESYVRYFTSRNPKSNWSRANRQRVERMMEQGRMTEAGLGLVKLAKESGAWTALQEVQESVIPPDLSEALVAGDEAEENFKAFRPSSKRIILEWILNAKRPETRRRRIEETVRLAEQNIKADHPRQ